MPNRPNGYLEDRASEFKAAGTPAAGSSLFAAPADHVHPAGSAADIGAMPDFVDAPASASATGKAGQMAYASGFLYVCVADNTWQRVAIATWT